MPSEKILASKQARVAELSELLKKSVAVVLVDYKGITVEQDTQLRKEPVSYRAL
ncbi:MAG: 50S ribosomal protein L10, partial [Oscillospiraceae bacterium]|nr:50S ribosomal protein L10 [Oscillospiraceae bacterium]